MKRVFITGIAGFIGFHLGLALKRRGDVVLGCDNFNAYYDPSLKKERARLLTLEGITIFENHKITHFVHLAAQAGVRYSLKHPESYVHSNLSGFVQILEALRRFPHIKLVYA